MPAAAPAPLPRTTADEQQARYQGPGAGGERGRSVRKNGANAPGGDRHRRAAGRPRRASRFSDASVAELLQSIASARINRSRCVRWRPSAVAAAARLPPVRASAVTISSRR